MDFEYLRSKFKETDYEMGLSFEELESEENNYYVDSGTVRVKTFDNDLLNNSELLKKKIIRGMIHYSGLKGLESEVNSIYLESSNRLDKILNEYTPFTDRLLWIKRLKNIKQEITPIIYPLTENYFGKEFIKDYLENYKNLNLLSRAAIVETKESNKYYINLNDSNDKNFEGESISGEGIWNIIHELTHLYHYSLFGKFDLRYELKEGHCEISAYDILINSNNSELEKAKEYAIKTNKELLDTKRLKKEKCLGSYIAVSRGYNYLSEEKDPKKREEMILDVKQFKGYIKSNFSHKSRGKLI